MLHTTNIDTHQGGVDLTISLTYEQAIALGDDSLELMRQMDTVLLALAAARTGQEPPQDASAKPTAWSEQVIRDTSALLHELTGLRNSAIRKHATQPGGSYGRLARALGTVRATAQYRRNTLTPVPQDPEELWALGLYADVDARAHVPPDLRPWSVAWPGYRALAPDITPPELRDGEGLAESVAEGWAEPYATPEDVPIHIRTERQATALVPFERDDRGRGLNPAGRTGRKGRNLGKWDENAAADPIVIAGQGPARRVLLIKRDDCGHWGIPGGMVDPGETAPAALVRELREETNIDLSHFEPVILDRCLVADPRVTDDAWIATTVAMYELADTIDPTAGDDATDARWWPFHRVSDLADRIEAKGGKLYDAHRILLATALSEIEDRRS